MYVIVKQCRRLLEKARDPPPVSKTGNTNSCVLEIEFSAPSLPSFVVQDVR
jgi:hypothetical protein